MKKGSEKLRVLFSIILIAICFGGLFNGTVFVNSANTIKARSIELNINKVTVNIGGVITLQARLNPINSTTKIKWSSKDKSIVSVNSLGVITGISDGITTVIAKTENGKSASCLVTVKSELTELDVKKLIKDNFISKEEIDKIISEYTLSKVEIEGLVNKTSNTTVIANDLTQNEFNTMLQYSQSDTSKSVLAYPNQGFEWITTNINGTVTGSSIIVNINNINASHQNNDFNQIAVSNEKNKHFYKYKYTVKCNGFVEGQYSGDKLYIEFQPISNGVQLSYLIGEFVEINNDGSFNYQCITNTNSMITEIVFSGIDFYKKDFIDN